MLARLEQEGYIIRKQDWKTKTIMLSEQGTRIMEQAIPEQLKFQSSMFEGALSEEELKTLYSLLTKVHKASLEINVP